MLRRYADVRKIPKSLSLSLSLKNGFGDEHKIRWRRLDWTLSLETRLSSPSCCRSGGPELGSGQRQGHDTRVSHTSLLSLCFNVLIGSRLSIRIVHCLRNSLAQRATLRDSKAGETSSLGYGLERPGSLTLQADFSGPLFFSSSDVARPLRVGGLVASRASGK